MGATPRKMLFDHLLNSEPTRMESIFSFRIMWKDIGLLCLLGISVAAVCTLLHFGLFRLLHKLADKKKGPIDTALVKCAKKPSLPVLIASLFLIFLPLLKVDTILEDNIRHVVTILLIASSTWLMVMMLHVGEKELFKHYFCSDTINARRIRTSLIILKRVLVIMVVVLAVAACFMTFRKAREFGYGLFASAGILGLIVGVAATPSLANVFACIQIALTDPFRIDDVVIINGEWGRIEEITTTYVVVLIWDQRRMIVPLSKFISEPFQNWTRVTPELLGTVFLYVDYTTPVPALRQHLKEILASTSLWDGRLGILQVTDCKEHTLELRCLVSAKNSSDAFDLRCYVRESMIEFIQKEFPGCLPKHRADVTNTPMRHPTTRLAETKQKEGPPRSQLLPSLRASKVFPPPATGPSEPEVEGNPNTFVKLED